ncbi:hypothetical protein BH10PSE12_BH10PSE12_01060 [soil metagenome]
MNTTENILSHGKTPSNLTSLKAALFLAEESMRRAILVKNWDAVRKWKDVRNNILMSIPGAGPMMHCIHPVRRFA